LVAASKKDVNREGWIRFIPPYNFMTILVNLGELGTLSLTFKFKNGKIGNIIKSQVDKCEFPYLKQGR